MALNHLTADYTIFSQEILLRSNFKTAKYGIEIKKKINSSHFQYVRLKDFFTILSGFAFKSSDFQLDGIPVIRIGDVGNDFDQSNMVYLPEDFEDDYLRFFLKKDDIIVSLTGDGKLKSDLVLEDEKYLLNQRVGSLRPKFKLNIKFYFYLINYYQLVKEQFYWYSNGKTQLNISPFDFLKIKVPKIDEIEQNKIVKRIEPVEQEISKIKEKILTPQGIIDKVFAQHFGFDIENADKKKKELVHYASLEDLANEELKFDISLKYRYIFLNYIKNPSNIEWIELGKLVDVKGGKRLPKGQNITEEETDYKYVRVDDLSWSGIFDLENIKYISEENHKAIKNYIAKENDILLTIVGATVGKCGLVPLELDEENITENFARLIIKDKENYLPEYVNYCLQSKTSVYQIDEYKGRGSQGKLALFRIKKIKMPKIGKTQQQEIVDEIKAELDKQELLKQQITTERNKIDKIIEECIMTAQ